MGYPSEDESIQGCASTYTGPEGGAGWVQELECGDTPDVRITAEQDQYYEDPNNPGNYHLYGFGILTSISSTFNPNQLKTRGIGNRDINCNKHSRYETELEVGYNPVDLVRIPFITGITDDIQDLDAPVCVEDCLPYSSVETWHEKECVTPKAARFLHNMMMVDTFSCTVSLGEFIEWKETLKGQYRASSASKVYTPPMQSTQVGLNPLDPCCTAFMAYEGDIYITRRVTNEDLTSQVGPGGDTLFILDYNVMDFNRDGVIDGELGDFQNRLCYRDIEVYVDGVMVNDTNTINVSDVNTHYIMLAHAVMPGSTITATYNYMYQMPNVTAYDFEIAHNVEESRGIWKGAPVPYEVINVTRDYTGNLTTNFKDLAEHTQMINDQYFHLFFEQGGNGDTPVVWIFCFVKWEEVNPPQSEDGLIELPLPWTATHLCLDNQIRLPPNTSIEEEG